MGSNTHSKRVRQTLLYLRDAIIYTVFIHTLEVVGGGTKSIRVYLTL